MSAIDTQIARMSAAREVAVPLGGRHRMLVNRGGRIGSSGDLFNHPSFLALHASSAAGIFFFELEDIASGKVVARSHFAVTPEAVRSPINGSYGSYELLEVLPGSLVEHFVLGSLAVLEKHTDLPVEIVSPPSCYDEAVASTLHNIFVRAGFANQVAELNYHREVLAGEKFSAGVNRGNIKRLRKALERKLAISLLEPSRHEEAYRLIAANRERRGFPITMSWAHLLEMKRAFPERVHFMGALDEDSMVASAVCLDVRPGILYVFYWGDCDGQQQLSPVTFLAQEIYAYCQERAYRLMDLGTSTVEGIPNWGLVGYKENLGFRASLKIRYHRPGKRG